MFVSEPSAQRIQALALCRTLGLWYLLLWIPFVLIITINDWFGYLNASFRETSLLCHCYKLLPKLCFTQGSFIQSFIFFCPRHIVTLLQAIVWEGDSYLCRDDHAQARESCGGLWGIFPPLLGEQEEFFPHLYLIKLFSATNYNHALLKIITNSCKDYRCERIYCLLVFLICIIDFAGESFKNNLYYIDFKGKSQSNVW